MTVYTHESESTIVTQDFNKAVDKALVKLGYVRLSKEELVWVDLDWLNEKKS